MKNDPDDLLPTRWTLIERLKNWDDQESWRQFFDTYWKLIYGVAIKSGLTHPEAQDVVQETVMSVCKNMTNFKADPAYGSFKAWLLTLTRWRITDQLRKRLPSEKPRRANLDESRRTTTMGRIADPHGPELDKIWGDEWRRTLAQAALQRIKDKVRPKQFQIFDCYLNKNWPVERITQTLGVSTTQVYLAKHRITAMLKKEIRSLEKNGI